MRHAQWLFLLMLAATPLYAQVDAGDAPAPYPTMDILSNGGPRLGVLSSGDALNPVTPAWTGDDDDGIVGVPIWTAGSHTNSLTVNVTIKGWTDENLAVWVDANDDGYWSQSERYYYGNGELIFAPGVFTSTLTFSNIFLPTMNYTLNGANKVAVRILAVYSWFGGVPGDGGGYMYADGEVEDWLIDVMPLGFAVSTDGPLTDAREGDDYALLLDAINGTPPYNWSLESGPLPSGLSIGTQGDQGLLSGNPVIGSAGTYNFSVRVNDSAGLTATRAYSLHVLPLPQPAPFRDNFSTDKGWTLTGAWSLSQASGVTFNVGTQAIREPGVDATPSNADNMILVESNGAAYASYGGPKWATSPEIDCTNLSVVVLRFKRFLSVNQWQSDKARVEVSNDGNLWTTIWNNLGPGGYPSPWPAIVDTDWVAQEFDITAYAAGQPRIQVRFGIGATDLLNNYAGWCIDDFEVLPAPSTTSVVATGMTIQTPASIGGVPACYKGSCYTFKATLSSNVAEQITLDYTSIALTSPPGTTPQDAGTLTLASPIMLAPLQKNVVVTGVFNCLSLPATGAGRYLLSASFWGSSSGGIWVECGVATQLEIQLGPGGPGHLEVYDGAQFLVNPAPATGGRDMGTRDINLGPSPALNISVRNTGTTGISIATPVLSNTADFSLDLSQWPPSLAGGATAIIGVHFDPSSIGAKIGTLSFTHTATASTDTPFVIALKGSGVDNVAAIEIRETDASGVIITYAATAAGARDFGTWDINAGVSASLTVYVENVGAQQLALPGFPSLSGPDAAEFGISYTGINRRLNPGKSTSFTIWFDPATVGTKVATVKINHTGLNEPTPFEFEITGLAVLIAPQLVVHEGTPGGAVIASNDPTLGTARDFGSRNVFAGPSGTLGIFVCNTGNADLIVSQPQLAGADNADFVLTAAQAIIVPGNWLMLMVAFDPASVGVKSTFIEFTHNAGTTFRCELTGVGALPQALGFLTPALLPSVAVNAGYGPVWIQGQGGTAPYSYALGGALPTGFVFNDAGRIIGAAECAPGLYQFDITVTDAIGAFVTQNFAIEVTPSVAFVEPPSTVAGDSDGVACHANAGGFCWGLLLMLLPLMAVAAGRRRRC